jgi:hypothetical protein
VSAMDLDRVKPGLLSPEGWRRMRRSIPGSPPGSSPEGQAEDQERMGEGRWPCPFSRKRLSRPYDEAAAQPLLPWA